MALLPLLPPSRCLCLGLSTLDKAPDDLPLPSDSLHSSQGLPPRCFSLNMAASAASPLLYLLFQAPAVGLYWAPSHLRLCTHCLSTWKAQHPSLIHLLRPQSWYQHQPWLK